MNSHPRNAAGPHRPGPSGEPIWADAVYPWRALHDFLGWGSRVVAKAIRDGLPVLVYGGRRYIEGRAIIEFLRRHPLGGDPAKGDCGDQGGPGE